jgi:hypothetical protein
MRRVTTIALLLQILLATSVLFLAPDGQENLPPCCRRDGKHHCMMMNRVSGNSAGGAVVKAAVVKCPLFPRGAIVPGSERYLVPTASQGPYYTVVTYPSIWAQVEGFHGISWSRSNHKRGPPEILSS